MLGNNSEVGEKSCSSCPVSTEMCSLVHWKKPIYSAVALCLLLVVQFSFVCLSAISIFAYLGFIVLVAVNGYRLYVNYIAKEKENAVMDYLHREVTISPDRVSDVSRRVTDHVNHGIVVARDLFLFTNVSRSIKFAVLLYILTIVGSCFNFLTLSIIATVLVFVLPKVYDRHKTEIDRAVKKIKDKSDKVMDQISTQLDKLPVIGHRKQKEQ